MLEMKGEEKVKRILGSVRAAQMRDETHESTSEAKTNVNSRIMCAPYGSPPVNGLDGMMYRLPEGPPKYRGKVDDTFGQEGFLTCARCGGAWTLLAILCSAIVICPLGPDDR